MLLSKPRVSVVMIFLDAGAYIDDAIRSVVAQHEVEDWELLLVDDGSTDQSSAIARRWADQDQRIRYLEHPGHENRGMSASRNFGIAEATGEWVAFLDSDDVWLPMMLRERMSTVERFAEVDGVIGGTLQWFTWDPERLGRGGADVRRPNPSVEFMAPLQPPKLFLAGYARPLRWVSPGICSVMARKRALDRIGGAESTFRALYEDQALYCKLALNLILIVDPRPFALYRQHPASTCSQARATSDYDPFRPHTDGEQFLHWLEYYIEREGMNHNPEIRRVVQRNMRVYRPVRRRWWTFREHLLSRTPEPMKRQARSWRDRLMPIDSRV
jgi:glycosyltransferase involved in cell wall biosynthesis